MSTSNSENVANQWPREELAEIARWQKCIIVILVLTFLSLILPMVSAGLNAFVAIRVVLFLVQAFCLYKLAVAIKADFPVLYVVSCLFPWANMIALLLGSMKATRILKANGIKVGLLGAKLPPLETCEEAA